MDDFIKKKSFNRLSKRKFHLANFTSMRKTKFFKLQKMTKKGENFIHYFFNYFIFIYLFIFFYLFFFICFFFYGFVCLPVDFMLSACLEFNCYYYYNKYKQCKRYHIT